MKPDQPKPADEPRSAELREYVRQQREPKPATGEWTVEEVTTPHHGKWDGIRFITDASGRHLGSMNEHEAKAVVDAHNATLAVERERFKETLEEIQVEAKKVVDQLDGDREKGTRWSDTIRELNDAQAEVQQLREQLTVERERKIEEVWKLYKGIDPETGEMWLTPRMERDARVIQLSWEIQELREQLSSEREKSAQAKRVEQVCYDIHEALGIKWGDDPYYAIQQLRESEIRRGEQLDISVEALKECSDCDLDSKLIADAALAKIGWKS